MKRQERRKLERELGKSIEEVGKKIVTNALQSFYESMRDNRIGEERADKILQDAVDRMGEINDML